MKKRDSSDTMINKQVTCKALAASEEELAIIYADLFKGKEGRSLTQFVHQLRGFNHEIHEKSIKECFFSKYFEDL